MILRLYRGPLARCAIFGSWCDIMTRARRSGCAPLHQTVGRNPFVARDIKMSWLLRVGSGDVDGEGINLLPLRKIYLPAEG